MLNGVTVAESTAQKDELILQGNDIDMVSQSGTRPICRALSFTSNIFAQLHLFRVYVGCGTRIFGNSWTVSMCQTRAQLSPSRWILTLMSKIACRSMNTVEKGSMSYYSSVPTCSPLCYHPCKHLTKTWGYHPFKHGNMF